MKRIRRLLLVLCALGLAVSGAGMTLAYPGDGTPTVLYDGQAQSLTLLNTTETDLFAAMKDLMPGDTRTQQVTLRAQNLQGEAALYLKAQCDDVTARALEPLTLSVYADGQLVDTGPAGGSAALQNGVLLYRFTADEAVPLQVELQVPVTVGNELADARHGLRWIFTLQAQESGGTGGSTGGGTGVDTGGGTGSGTGGSSAPAGTPGTEGTAAAAGTVQLIPRTEDRAPVGVWQIAFVVSAAGLLLALSAGRRKPRKEQG